MPRVPMRPREGASSLAGGEYVDGFAARRLVRSDAVARPQTSCVLLVWLALACGTTSNGSTSGHSSGAAGNAALGSSGAAGASSAAAGTSSGGAPSLAGASNAGGVPSLGGTSNAGGAMPSGGASGSSGSVNSIGTAGAAGGTSKAIQVQASGTCTAGQTSGTLISTTCFSPSDFATFGCVPGVVTSGGEEKTAASRAQMEAARFSITYSTTSQVIVYLCTGATPDAGWLCGNPLLGSCANINDQSSCGQLYILSPMPVYTVSCSQ